MTNNDKVQTKKVINGSIGGGKMTGHIDIRIENKLAEEKRDINVFHQSSCSAHLISHNSSVTIPLGVPDNNSDDYLHISVVKGQGYLWKDCIIDLPSYVNFDFFSLGNLTLRRTGDSNRILLRIPPGPPNWELKITGSSGNSAINHSYLDNTDHITIQDESVEALKQ
jgi:hypothetical protein